MLCSFSLSPYIYIYIYIYPTVSHISSILHMPIEKACTVVVEVLSVCREEEIKSLKEQLQSVSGKSAC